MFRYKIRAIPKAKELFGQKTLI